MAEVLDRRPTAAGEIVLRRTGAGFEIIVDGVFAMANHLGGRSEQHQVEVTLGAVDEPATVLIGGLGLGYALNRAVTDPRLRHIVVAEVEPAVIEWHHSYLSELTAAALGDPRVVVIEGDVAAVVDGAAARFDAIVLDVDNGPDWLIRPDNARLYEAPFVDACATALTPTGALSVWGAQPSARLRHAFDRRFGRVDEYRVEVPRGDSDWFCVASRPRR